MEDEEKKLNEQPEKPKKKKRFWRKLIIFVIILGIITIALGYLFPGLLWTKSLGVSYTKADYDSVMKKLEYMKDATPTGDSSNQYVYKYGTVQSVDIEFTSAEITSFFNENRPSYYPLKNVQIKINNDGTIEAVASANVDYFLDNILSGKYSKAQIQSYMPALGILPANINLYLKMDGSVINNKSNVGIKEVTVQGIGIPSNIVNSNEAIGTINEGIENVINKYNTKTGSSFNKIAIENGKIKFQGSVPSSLERVPVNQ